MEKEEAQGKTTFERVLAKELAYIAAKKTYHHNLERCEKLADANECSSEYAACVVEEANKAKLTGLAFSGGGIRSATFNLGVLQALARLKLLDQFDYLSTVSGGGYIGSWFTAWIHRMDRDHASAESTENSHPMSGGSGDDKQADAEDGDSRESANCKGTRANAPDDVARNGLGAVSTELAASVSARDDRRPRAAMQPDPDPVQHLREYSNYLSPRHGLWSTDTWTLGITYLRNFVLTFSLLLATLVTLVLATRVVTLLYFNAAYAHFEYARIVVPVLFCLSVFITALSAGIELSGTRNTTSNSRLCSNIAVFFALVAAVIGSLWLWQILHMSPDPDNAVFSNRLLPQFVPVALSGLLGWVLGLWYGYNQTRSNSTQIRSDAKFSQRALRRSLILVICAIFSLAVFAVLMLLLGTFMLEWLPNDMPRWASKRWLIVVWGTPLFVLVFSIVAVVFVGIAGRALNELEREWLGRFFAILTKYTVLTTFLVVLVVYSYCLVRCWDDNSLALVPATLWGLLSSAGAYLARNTISANTALQKWTRKTVLAVAPYVFILGVLVFTVWITDAALRWLVELPPVNGEVPGYWYWLAKLDASFVFFMGLAAAFITLALSWRVGVNRFSMHSMYAGRLIRAYLGASNLDRWRKVHDFTGFCESDNEVHLADLVRNNRVYSGPYPIINTSINLVSSKRLAWQRRKAASFFFTPFFSGYEYCDDNNEDDRRDDGRDAGSDSIHHSEKESQQENSKAERQRKRIGGFVETEHYTRKQGRGVSLGKAMAISGAAASPNMGYQSSPALTFLMTTFNVRLGWWLPNPAMDSPGLQRKPGLVLGKLYRMIERLGMPGLQQKPGPSLGLLYLLYELLGMTDARRNYVYLSDGGHFENLAVYELVRRRCRIIVACDAEADPQLTFSGLGNAIEKCQTDLGVPITIDLSNIKRDPQTGLSAWHCAIGCIRYSEADRGQADGVLVYIKASLTGDEPQNVATYARSHETFPHQTTADQWFDETQFESYRSLGEHTIYKVLGNAVQIASSSGYGREVNERCIERTVLEARKQWYPGANVYRDRPIDHDAALGEIMETLRNEKKLEFLDEQLYPNLRKMADSFSGDVQNASRPADYAEFRAGFYFCKRLIQFMQQVYYGLELDIEYAAPRNRGWMNLFRRWSWSRMLRFTWTMTAGTYGARFQSFCEHHLNLESGDPEYPEKPFVITAAPSSEEGRAVIELHAPDEYGQADFDWDDLEKFSGMHYYETRLIREFIDAYVHLEELKACAPPYRFEVFPVTVKTDDPVQEDVDTDLNLNAGLLIAGPSCRGAATDNKELINAILYFRIRPSMRNMDLARKAFLKCSKHPVLKKYPTSLEIKLPVHGEITSAWQRRAHGEVHSLNQENLDHCRWYSQLLNEMGEDADKSGRREGNQGD